MDNLFVKAITIAAKTETYYCVSMPTPEWSLSEETEKTILGYADMKEKKRLAPRQLIAILIAAALLVALSITAYAYREQIGNLIESIFDDHNEYKMSGGAETRIETVVAPKYIPYGFIQSEYQVDETAVNIIWKKESSEIDLYYIPVANGTIFVDTDGATQGEITIDGITIKTYIQHSSFFALWEKDNYAFMFLCPEELGLEEIEKIIRSIEPVEDAGE